ncbi:MAG: ATP-binding protein [Bacteroidetes bacterium]|nr:ATP-binding protein [Bacteroidota bacterium]
MIIRKLESFFGEQTGSSNVVLLSGPSGSGKTAVVRQLYGSSLWLDGNLPDEREFLRSMGTASLLSRLGANKCLVIDNAQRIENLETTVISFAKELPGFRFIICSSFPGNKASIKESMNSGSISDVKLLPLSFQELVKHHSLETEIQLIDHRIIFGYYPEVVANPGNEISKLHSLAGHALIKDILLREKIQKTDGLEHLIQLLALNIGRTVSNHDLGKQAGMTNETVDKYLQLLEKAFVIFRLEGYAKDLKNELVKSRKFYFYDTGIRNAVINQFGAFSLRNDAAALWENFIIAERRKYLLNNSIQANCYFWRTKDKAQVDYIEEYNGKLAAYQIFSASGKKVKFSKSFLDSYHPTETTGINRENFQGWLWENKVEKPDRKKIVVRRKDLRQDDISMEID